MQLRTIPDLRSRFGVPAGLSDHSLDPVVPVTAVALGACIIEKHLTMSRARGGPDGAFSLEPAEFRAMVDAVRSAEKALGGVCYGEGSDAVNRVFRRSLFVTRAVRKDETFSSENVRCIRPGHGLHPRYLDGVLGRRAAADVARGTPLRWALVEGGAPPDGTTETA
jgi:N-acetylneuraminate synthase